MMKTMMNAARALVLMAALAITAPALAQAPQQDCRVIEDLARTAMTARQMNKSMSFVMGQFMDVFNDRPEAVRDLMRSIVMGAYEKPSFQTQEYQQREIDDYANFWARACFQTQQRKR